MILLSLRFQPTEAVAQKMIHDAFSPRLLRRYKWGFRKNAQLPCFVFLTRKKRWTKGRALISYFQSFQATLLKATSRALDSTCKQIVPSSLAYIFSALGCFWRSVAGFCRQYTGSNYIELYNIASQTFVKFGTVFLQDLSTGLT